MCCSKHHAAYYGKLHAKARLEENLLEYVRVLNSVAMYDRDTQASTLTKLLGAISSYILVIRSVVVLLNRIPLQVLYSLTQMQIIITIC